MAWYRVHFRTKQIIVEGDAELERVKARKVPKVILVEPMKVHTCDQCGKEEAWLDSWRWYGSYSDLEDGKPIIRLCSDECQDRFAMRGVGKPSKRAEKAAKANPWAQRDAISGFEPRGLEDRNWRAVDNAKRAANPRQFVMPAFPADRSGNGWCRWCGKAVQKPARTWHPDCLHQYYLHTSSDSQYAHLVERDGWGCGICGRANGRVERAHLVWHNVQSQTGLSHLRWSEILEIDHVIELWEVQDLPDDERRHYFGPGNLWLLCKPCHKRKSAAARSRQAASRS